MVLAPYLRSVRVWSLMYTILCTLSRYWISVAPFARLMLICAFSFVCVLLRSLTRLRIARRCFAFRLHWEDCVCDASCIPGDFLRFVSMWVHVSPLRSRAYSVWKVGCPCEVINATSTSFLRRAPMWRSRIYILGLFLAHVSRQRICERWKVDGIPLVPDERIETWNPFRFGAVGGLIFKRLRVRQNWELQSTLKTRKNWGLQSSIKLMKNEKVNR